MTTLTVDASLNGFIYGLDATYSTARTTAYSGATYMVAVGQYYSPSVGYYCYEGQLQFNTSALPDDATISAVTLKLYPQYDGSDTDFTINVLGYNWGASLELSDWRTPTQAGALTNYGTYNTSSGFSGGYKSITGNASFISAINKTGTTYAILTSDRWQSGNTPTGSESVQIEPYSSATPPQLVIEYTSATEYIQSVSGTMGTLTGTLATGHIYTQAIAGAISSMTSTLVKAANKAVSGTLSASGSLSKLTTKSFSVVSGALSGSVSSAAVILHQISGTMGALSGTVSNLQTGFGANLAGAVGSMSGSISRSIGKPVSGTLTATGNVFKMNTFRFAIMKAGTVVRKVIQGGRDY